MLAGSVLLEPSCVVNGLEINYQKHIKFLESKEKIYILITQKKGLKAIISISNQCVCMRLLAAVGPVQTKDSYQFLWMVILLPFVCVSTPIHYQVSTTDLLVLGTAITVVLYCDKVTYFLFIFSLLNKCSAHMVLCRLYLVSPTLNTRPELIRLWDEFDGLI